MLLSSISAVWTSKELLIGIPFSRIDLEFDELQSVLQYLPPSFFYLVMKSAEKRSDYAKSMSSIILVILSRVGWQVG